MVSMNKLDKILFAVFILVTLVFLWLVSPMGQLYLPLDKSQLEDTLAFTLPDKYELKGIDDFKDCKVYHLRTDDDFPHIISLVVQPKTPLMIDDVFKPSTKNEPINKFWASTTFTDIKENGCIQEISNDKVQDLCSFEATWPIINNDNKKEGQFSLINKANKTVFIMSSAVKETYNNEYIKDIIENIVK